MICVLAGGVGAAKLLRGLVHARPHDEIVAIVNTGDDTELHGLTICPDLDTVTYTVGAVNDDARGWGLAGESWQAMAALERFAGVAPRGSSAGATWFRLGDRDLATHLYRSQRLRDGAPLHVVTAEIASAFAVSIRIVPMTNDAVRTRLTLAADGREVGFQEYFVGLRHDVAVRSIRFAGIDAARPAPGVLDAIADADVVVIAPSNPLVSIGPVLAVPGVTGAIAARRGRVVAVSPIVGGRALKGPADRMLRELGSEASVVGVARAYRQLASTLVIDHADAALAPAVHALGIEPVVTSTVMHDVDAAVTLAAAVVDAGSVAR